MTTATDAYSFGVLAYQVLVGQTPFTGDSPMEIALSHISDPPPSPRRKPKVEPPHHCGRTRLPGQDH